METLTQHTIESAPKASVENLGILEETLGFIPNVFAAIAESPCALAGFMALNTHFAESSFSDEEQQVIQLATSTENECVYCVAGHTAFCQQLNISNDITAAMRDQKTVPSARLQALSQLTRSLIKGKGQITEKDIGDFYAAGYIHAQFFELIMGICVKYFSNLVSNALTLPLDSVFEPYAWVRPQ